MVVVLRPAQLNLDRRDIDRSCRGWFFSFNSIFSLSFFFTLYLSLVADGTCIRARPNKVERIGVSWIPWKSVGERAWQVHICWLVDFDVSERLKKLGEEKFPRFRSAKSRWYVSLWNFVYDIGYDDIFETADSDMQDAYYLHSFYDQSKKAVLIPWCNMEQIDRALNLKIAYRVLSLWSPRVYVYRLLRVYSYAFRLSDVSLIGRTVCQSIRYNHNLTVFKISFWEQVGNCWIERL